MSKKVKNTLTPLKKNPIDRVGGKPLSDTVGGKSKKKKGGAYSRRKGHTFERAIAIQLREVFPEARRQLEYHADDAKGIDIQNAGDYKIQCKNTAKYVPINTIKEVQCDRVFGDIPVLIAKAANEPTLAVIYWEDLLNLIKWKEEY